MADVLAVAEFRAGEARPVARETVSVARRLADALGGRLDVVAAAGPGGGEAAAGLARHGADRILVSEDETFAAYAPDALVASLAAVAGAGSYGAIVFAGSAQGKDLSARAAARLGRSLATEVTEVDVEDGRVVVTRPVYAGKAYARLAFRSAPAVLSIRPNVFPAAEREGAGEVEPLPVEAVEPRTRVVGTERGERERLDVREAEIVVSGGRGLQDPERWTVLEDLVEALGPTATLGASRAVVDAGWRPHGEQVGQTGKVVSPNLYFAIGISGAIQHLAGMRTARVIVAVNRDPDAPIFSVANYGIVGDVFEVVPKLTEAIRALRGG
ncbi:MAG: electron transfer flavoprotein subunit alpha/FixB family protein [Gemmatimonadota bacterium]|nr:electron transfer flavoprotein subunit alpha/FixB family protein [Gemmatimonadota bacterium]